MGSEINKAMEIIACNYDILKGSLVNRPDGNVSGQGDEDFLQDAVLQVFDDSKVNSLTKKKDILDRVKFRFKMFNWRAHHEKKEVPFSELSLTGKRGNTDNEDEEN